MQPSEMIYPHDMHRLMSNQFLLSPDESLAGFLPFPHLLPALS